MTIGQGMGENDDDVIDIFTGFELIEQWAKKNGILQQPPDMDALYKNVVKELGEAFDAATTGQMVEEIADVIVFCVIEILRRGYNPDIVLDEVIKKISSRTAGAWDEKEGKRGKDSSLEAKAKEYQCDMRRAIK